MILQVIYENFKSFADKIVVDFVKGLTVVIGPNGCGKSNIIDGIRWVFGEQSAKALRGGSMDELIFHGTEKRKEAKMASVTIVLDNSTNIFKNVQTPTVSVTRRTFRKGGSEYLINGQPSKLKEVQMLFMDSGIGSRSYSIIGQEKVQHILSTKPEERRAIFEEAAGIVKFKKQKISSEKKLVEIENNLSRMKDITHELDKRLNPLKKQSEKYQMYKELSESLLAIELNYLLTQYDRLKEEVATYEDSFQQSTKTVHTLKETIHNAEEELEHMKTSYHIENENAFSSQSELSDKKEKIDKLTNEVNVLVERNHHSESKVLDVSAQINHIMDKHELTMKEFTQRNERLEQLNTEWNQKSEIVERNKEKINSTESDKLRLVNHHEHLRQKIVDLYNLITQKKFEITQLKERTQEHRDKKEMVKQALASIDADYRQAKQEFEERHSQYTTCEQEKDTYIANIQEKKERIRLLSENHSVKNKKVSDMQRDYFHLKSKTESLESMIDRNDNFFGGVKAVLNEKKKGMFPNVLGALAELIEVQPNYERAVDNLLQSASQSILTTNDDQAKECVSYLKKNKLGKATFLPLNLAKPSSFNADEITKINQSKHVSLATDFLTFSDDISNVILSKLGRCLIASDLDEAVEFVKRSNIRAKVATMDGEVIQTGAITGGATSHQKQSYFEQKRELEKNKEAFEKINEQLEKEKEEMLALDDELASLRSEVEATEQTLFQTNNNLSGIYSEMKDAENTYNKLHEKKEDYTTELEESTLAIKESTQKEDALKEELVLQEKRYEETNHQLDNIHSKRENQNDDLAHLFKETSDVENELIRMEEERKQLVEYIQTSKQSVDEITQQLESLRSKEEEEQKLIKENELTIHELSSQIRILQDDFETNKQKLTENKEASKQVVQVMNDNEQKLKELRLQLEKEEKEYNSLNVKKSKKEVALSNVLQRMLEEYDVTEEKANDYKRQDIDIDETSLKIDELKAKISSLGNINHNAQEEYDELNERHMTETQQLKDAEKAKEDLVSLLKNIEEEMKTKFLETFNNINEQFAVTFPRLFKGGRAELKLKDPKNPLTSEINIFTQPPGKILKNIDLLSGGEKSLAAVALIFAMILSKKSPFIILDEVDAPLDDVVVARFAKFLKELSQDSQFIVISHRKGTKMEANQIYGVTHEELGVSVVSSVSLDFNEQTG